LNENSVIRKIRIVQQEGNREVSREIEFYNLDAIIAVGYRVNSKQATQFRIWATKLLREFIIKGFVLDDERLRKISGITGSGFYKRFRERSKAAKQQLTIAGINLRTNRSETQLYVMSASVSFNRADDCNFLWTELV